MTDKEIHLPTVQAHQVHASFMRSATTPCVDLEMSSLTYVDLDTRESLGIGMNYEYC
jgi:hypothetical protein